eukprot:gnl/Dysnectes_brevis/1461_a1655_2236.p1 GENE.gnl/Dysnectes_brevis/1461_a1655_2236~~gnl/Dysnectes_brevis/1461_a1655_2236.p1  ORF type:complete len:416 (-),score=117.40 gnl/Dysnectes_brevis/1461_a1655_2236:33-1280(-)
MASEQPIQPADVEEVFEIDPEILQLSDSALSRRIDLINGETNGIINEITRLKLRVTEHKRMADENKERIKINKHLPRLVASIAEIIDVPDGDEIIKGVVIKTSSRQTVFLPQVGLVPRDRFSPGDLVGVNKDSYLILESLPAFHDSRVKAMEVIEKPTATFEDVGGLSRQIDQLVEAVVMPFTHAENFKRIGIKPPKGVLLYGPPGTGKTLLARACSNHSNAAFFKLAGTELIQMYIGDGAKMVRDCFELAREKSPSIIFIDELDAVGTKRFDSSSRGDREVQRTMLELLNQMDGFSSTDDIKVIAATNRIDVLDPALLRSGRFDRKIEFPLPHERARAHILKIHSEKMSVREDVNFDEIARITDDFNGAQLKAVCVEAGMLALRRGVPKIRHEDFVEAASYVIAKRKGDLKYFI